MAKPKFFFLVHACRMSIIIIIIVIVIRHFRSQSHGRLWSCAVYTSPNHRTMRGNVIRTTELTADQVHSVPSYTEMPGGFVVCIFRLSFLRPSFFTNLMYAEMSGEMWAREREREIRLAQFNDIWMAMNASCDCRLQRYSLLCVHSSPELAKLE